MTHSSLYHRAATAQITERPPVWLMRQAGRYMAEYQAIRKKYDFLTMIRTPELAAEITLQPIQRFGMDVAILFSDILVTAEALGVPVQFVDGVGPVLKVPERWTLQTIQSLSTAEVASKTAYVTRAIAAAQELLKPSRTPLLGFAGAPFTIACYLLEGGSSHDMKKAKTFFFQNPDEGKLLLDKITAVTIDYLNAQIAAGVDGIQLFESWAQVLSWEDFQTIALPQLKCIVSNLKNPRNVPITVFARGSSVLFPQFEELGIDVISLDWQTDISAVRRKIHPDIALQGNLDPMILFAPQQLVKDRVQRLLESMRDKAGFIFNLGHGILPQTPVENVACLVDTVKNFK